MIVLSVFLVIAIIMIFIGIVRGTVKSRISFITNIINCSISFLISRVLVGSLGVKVKKELINYIGNNYDVELFNISAMNEFLEFFMSIAVGVIGFYLIYFIVFIISTILKHVLFYPKASENYSEINVEKEKSIIDITEIVIVSSLSVALTFVLMFTPIGFVFNTMIEATNYKNGEKLPFVWEAYFDKLTEMPNNKNNIKSSEELKYIANVAFSTINVNYENDKDKNDSKRIQEVKNSFENSYFMPTVIGEAGASAAKEWKKGNNYLGIEFEIPDGREGKLLCDFLDILEKWNRKSVVEDVNTLIDISVLAEAHDFEDMGDEEALLKELADGDFLEELFVILYKNNDFANLVSSFIEFGLGSAFDSININFDDNYDGRVDITELSEEEVRNEAKIVSGIIKTILEVKDFNDSEIDEENFEKIKNDVMKLSDSKILVGIADEFVNQLSNNLDNVQF